MDINQVFLRGGKQLVELLEFSVISLQPDPLFAFLVGEYRLRPTAEGAVALYDVFCAPGTPARISPVDVLPPRNLRIQQDIETLRMHLLGHERARSAMQDRQETEESRQDHLATEDMEIPSIPVPGKYLFDAIVVRVWQGHSLRSLARSYDPGLSPQENLPDGRMTASQKHFVDKIWEPQLRPYLASAGFRRIANIA